MRILGAILAGLFGLAFGSFLNVCLTRWTAGESVVHPGSHCRSCQRSLSWWENVPLATYLILRGRCRTCGSAIGFRYFIVELSVGILWGLEAYRMLPEMPDAIPPAFFWFHVFVGIGLMAFFWLLVALAILDTEQLWLPNWLTWPGIFLGVAASITEAIFTYEIFSKHRLPVSIPSWLTLLGHLGIQGEVGFLLVGPVLWLLAVPALSAAPLLLVRWLYWLIRQREGLGMGDVKLMALLGAWLGLPDAILALFIGVVLGGATAVVLLLSPKVDRPAGSRTRLPFGTFLCIGGIVSALWGQSILSVYLRLAGF